MPTHFLLRNGPASTATVVRPLLTGYAISETVQPVTPLCAVLFLANGKFLPNRFPLLRVHEQTQPQCSHNFCDDDQRLMGIKGDGMIRFGLRVTRYKGNTFTCKGNPGTWNSQCNGTGFFIVLSQRPFHDIDAAVIKCILKRDII